MFEQYLRLKEGYPDALLFYRMGDFYELFFEDAEVASRELQIALTSRNPNAEAPIPMCGVPWHAAEGYVSQLLNKGYKIAFCDQVEDPRAAKGLVERAVTRVYTPGTAVEDVSLEPKGHTYLGALFWSADTDRGGFAWVDVSTGYWAGLHVKKSQELWQWAQKIAPRELLLPEDADVPASLHLTDIQAVRVPLRSHFDYKRSAERVLAAQSVAELGALGLEGRKELVQACGALLAYLEQTQMQDTKHLAPFEPLDLGQHLLIDDVTERNLELFRRLDGRKGVGTLRHVIDSTQTPMGGRLLKRWIAMPIKDPVKIGERLDVVDKFVRDADLADVVREQVALVGDMERIASRIAAARVTPRELVQLKNSLFAVELLKAALESTDDAQLHALAGQIDLLEGVRDRIAREIYPDPLNNQIQKGGVIADGVDPELDDLRRIALHGKDYLARIQQRESEATGIPSLKISYNNVFGYYIEVRNAHKEKVPETWIRKQTLANAERYITEELKEYEEKILGAEEKMLVIEQRIYADIIAHISRSLSSLLRDAAVVARIDCLQSFARLACERRYVRPVLDDGKLIDIRQGRHPVIETLLPVGEEYVPNDVMLDDKEQQIMMITGPNMSGKSALLRQTALIILMAQMGSFVPAKSAHIGVVDKIFTRVGASDNISQGESTFMVEMLESASILNNISDRSIVLLDEIGRGTSTYDGISIAWAMVEYLHNHPSAHAKTLFATHYHELNEMEQMCPRVKNFHVSVKEMGNQIVFLRKLERGGTEHSFGIHVARMAGMPVSVVSRADEILRNLELVYGNNEIVPSRSIKNRGKKPSPSVKEAAENGAPQNMQLSMFQLDDPVLVQIRDQIKGLDINSLTPIEALNKLNEIKKITGI